jgi:hypothetical protein
LGRQKGARGGKIQLIVSVAKLGFRHAQVILAPPSSKVEIAEHSSFCFIVVVFIVMVRSFLSFIERVGACGAIPMADCTAFERCSTRV